MEKNFYIYSNNGTNFANVDQELKQSLEEWNESQISDFLIQKAIQWHFNSLSSLALLEFGSVWFILVRKPFKGCYVVK